MTLSDQINIEGWNAQLGVAGLTVVLTASKQTFPALINNEPAVDLDGSRGPDIREKAVVEALKTSVPASLLAADAPSQIKCTVGGVAIVMTRREDELFTPFVKFDVIKIL